MSLANQVKNASRSKMIEEFKGLHVNFNQGEWLSGSNIYRTSYVNDNNPISHKDDYQEYLASSIILHLSDAWSYLKSAINASLLGDHISAQHMAYYAELRATMSILASEGIGVHNHTDYYINKDGDITELGGHPGTHEATWTLFKAWSKQKTAKKLLENTISYEGETIQQWINSLGVGKWTALAESLLTDWGMDLEVLSRDTNIRNGASYNPNQLLVSSRLSACDNVQFFCELWGLFTPSKTSQFPMIDKELIRRSLHKVKENMTEEKFNEKIEHQINNLLYGSGRVEKELEYFKSEQTSFFFTMSNESHSTAIDAMQDPQSHLQIIARASLLLRLATGSAKQLILDSGIQFDDMLFWWNDLAINNGIWDNSNTLTSSDLNNLWLDIDEFVLQEIDEKQCDSTISLHTIKNDNELSKSLYLFAECERIMLWGLSS